MSAMACCASNIGPDCAHALTRSARELAKAARRSVALIDTRDPQSGRIPGDPLETLIPGDGEADAQTLADVASITGSHAHHKPPRGTAANTAPASRAMLRRWAERTFYPSAAQKEAQR